MTSFASVENLNDHLATRSYVTGYNFSADDKAAFAALSGAPSSVSHPHAYRWALHVAALSGTRFKFLVKLNEISTLY